MNKKRIGFLSFWGWGRGQANVTLCYAKMLQGKYDIFILKQATNPIEEDFKTVNVHITEYPKSPRFRSSFINRRICIWSS